MEPITWFLTGMEKHSDSRRDDLYGNAEAFKNSMIYNMAHMPGPSLQTAMNELSNHDHSRFLTRTNRRVGRMNTLGSDAASQGIDKGVMREAVVMQMTWVGAPTVYYGDEAGVCGFTDRITVGPIPGEKRIRSCCPSTRKRSVSIKTIQY